MAVTTQGYRPTTQLQFTPVDPRYAIRDPFAFSAGLNRGLADMQTLEQDAMRRADLPRLQMLKDIELAQAQAELNNLPAQKRLKDLQIANAERQLQQSMFDPLTVGKPIRELDENGNIVEYQPLSDFNPATGTAYGPGEKPAMDVSLVKTKDQLEAEQRALQALAQNRTNLGEAALIRATNPTAQARNTVTRIDDNENQRVIERVTDPQGKIVEERVVVDPVTKKPIRPKPILNPITGKPLYEPKPEADGDQNAASVFGGSAAPSAIIGTQAPANATGMNAQGQPDIRVNIPKGSFQTAAEAEAAVANGLIQVQPGDIVLIGGVPMQWQPQ